MSESNRIELRFAVFVVPVYSRSEMTPGLKNVILHHTNKKERTSTKLRAPFRLGLRYRFVLVDVAELRSLIPKGMPFRCLLLEAT